MLTIPGRTTSPAMKSVAGWLPRGHALSEEVWQARHRFMQWILWLHLPFLAAVGIANGETIGHVLLELAIVAGMAFLGRVSRSRAERAVWISLGLVSCSGMLVHFTGGLIESHFHFFVILPVVALYQDWRPFLSGVAFVFVHHGVVGSLSPTDVYNHPAALARPVTWAFIHATYVLALVAVLIFHWRFAEKAEAARRASDERFRSSFEEAPIGMCLTAPDGRFVQVNQALCAMLGRSAEELLSLSWSDITHPEDQEASTAAVRRLLGGEAPSVGLEKRYLRPDGAELWGKVSISMISDQDGAPLYMIAQIEDVTDRRRYQERLEGLVRSKDDFVASVSHELRTPLTAVVGLTQLLREASLPNRERGELVEIVADQSAELSYIVEDLLVAARSEIGRLSVVPEAMDLWDQARQVLAALGGDAAGRIRIAEALARAWADPSRVRQVLRNLLTNALRYGGERIEVRFGQDRGLGRVLVCDDGPEIPEEQRERMFEPYQRTHDARTQPASVGLGLTISRQLARLMGGDLTYRWIDGESRFELTLPAAAPRAGASADLSTEPAAVAGAAG